MTPIITRSQAATIACLLEVSAPKPGNVHRAADFHDTTLNDFLLSAVAIGPVLEQAPRLGVGQTVLEGIQATQFWVRPNTNLGILLLLGPLAAVPDGIPLASGVASELDRLDRDDAEAIYRAIRLARPGGLQPVDHAVEVHNVDGPPPDDLLAAMRLAADDDLIARQYVNQFADVFDFIVPRLIDANHMKSLVDRIIFTAVSLMAEFPDSLIRRKAGSRVAEESAARARQLLDFARVDRTLYYGGLAELDFWLRSDSRRNPGTTADLIAAGLFVAIREGMLPPPFHW